QLSEGGSASRTQSRPPVMWTWAAILTVGAVIIAVVFWLVTLAPQEFQPNASREVPELANLDRGDALDALRQLELVPLPIERTSEKVPGGKVISTAPEAGAVLSPGDKVTVFVSTGPESAEVPEFTRMSLEEYTTAVEELGLTVGQVTQQDDPIAA